MSDIDTSIAEPVTNLDKPRTIADDILSRYRPSEPDFALTLPLGEILRFRCMENHGELESLKARAAEFVKAVMRGQFHAGPGWDEVKILNPATLSKVFFVSELSVEPKLTILDAMKIAQLAGIFEGLVSAIDARSSQVANEAEQKGVEAAKNGSPEALNTKTD